MTEAWQIALVTGLVNAAVTWGVISTKLAWLRRDVDELQLRLRDMEHARTRELESETSASLRASKLLTEMHQR